MRLTIIGSSDAFNSAGRGNACYWIDTASGPAVMVDCGPTALQALRRLGKDPNAIGTVLLTHLHGDHTAGLPFLLVDALYNRGRQAPLEIVGPVGTERRIRELVQACYDDILDKPRFAVAFRELAPGDEVAVGAARVRAWAALHMDPPQRPLCLRFTGSDGRSIAFSGDTAMCEGLLAACDGVDLALVECTGTAQPAGKHCTWDEWRTALAKLGARRVILTHLGEAVRAQTAALLAESVAGPPYSFAEDGLELVV